MTRRTRLEQAEHIAAAERRPAAGETQRGVAAAAGVARSTLQGWCRDGIPGTVRPGKAACSSGWKSRLGNREPRAQYRALRRGR
jgi:hypothetical protein